MAACYLYITHWNIKGTRHHAHEFFVCRSVNRRRSQAHAQCSIMLSPN